MLLDKCQRITVTSRESDYYVVQPFLTLIRDIAYATVIGVTGLVVSSISLFIDIDSFCTILAKG
jgi:hypothetical protein